MIIASIICATLAFLATLKMLYELNRPRCSEGEHKFEARFNEESKPPEMDSHVIFMTPADHIEAASVRKKTYIHDLCVHCGKVVKAEGKGVVFGHYADTGITSEGKQ